MNATELTKIQFFTMSTCGEACWEAKEEVCHCSCHGKNHGILRTGNRPKRTCKIQGFWYELHTITDYPTAKKLCQTLREEHAIEHPEEYGKRTDGRAMVYYDSTPGDAYHCKAPSESQKKWTEFINADIEGYPMMIWKRIPAPTA